MRPTEEFQNEHDALRAQLAVLKEWLPRAHSNPFQIERLVSSIARRLRTHMEKETTLCSALRDAPCEQTHEPVQRLLAEHEHQRQILSANVELLLKSTDAPLDQVVQCASTFASDLQEVMAREELSLFPLMDRLLGDAIAQTLPEPGEERCSPLLGRHSGITAVMRVNRVLQIHSNASSIFQAFGINVEHDKLAPLETFTRRGLDVEALLMALNQSLGVQSGAPSVPELLWGSCDAMMVIDGQRRILAMNQALERLTGHRISDVVGERRCGTLLDCRGPSGDQLACHREQCPGLRAMSRLKSVKAAEYTVCTAAGRRIAVSASYTPIQPYLGGSVWALVIIRDMRLQKRRERQLAHRVLCDPLTDVMNRAGFLATHQGRSRLVGPPRPAERRRHTRVLLVQPTVNS